MSERGRQQKSLRRGTAGPALVIDVALPFSRSRTSISKEGPLIQEIQDS